MLIKISLCALGLSTILLSAPRPQEERARPRDVTAETEKTPRALRRLQRGGKLFFSDGFESGDSKHWFNRIGEKEKRLRFLKDSRKAHSGAGVLELECVDRHGTECAAGVSLWFDPGYERVHFRRYIRFAEDYDQGSLHHVGGSLYAVAGSNRWAQMGKAGIRPTGEDRFGASFEPWNAWRKLSSPGALMLYTYWMDMKGDRGGKYWGNNLHPSEQRRTPLKRGRWYCLEHMISAGTPGKADGELAAWVDGKLYVHYRGFRWSTAPLRLKRISLGLYVHRSKQRNRVWYDDVALSTGYIGPLNSKSTGKR